MDKFRKAVHRWTGQLDANGIADATVDNFGLISAAGLPTDTEINMTIQRVDSTGKISPATEEVITGTVSGNRLINVRRGVHGTAQPHPASASVEVILAAAQWNDMINGILKEHNQDGTHAIPDNGGWTRAPEDVSIASIDAAAAVLRFAGDANTRYMPGMRVQYMQTQAMTAYWTFDSSYDPAVGIYSMFNIGAPTYTTGKYGNALTLNGSSALGVVSTDALMPTGDFHIHMCIKTTNKSDSWYVFQSHSKQNNLAGFFIQVAKSSGYVQFCVGNNTAQSYGESQGFRSIIAPVDVADGEYHTIDVAYRNNYAQMYIDGKNEASGYVITPVYAAPSQTYIRIGCACFSGTNSNFFPGQIDDLFLVNGYALDENTVRTLHKSNIAKGVDPITVTKHAIIQDVGDYTGTHTPVTIWGGTDYSTVNAPIMNLRYSCHKAPMNFPVDPRKWQIQSVFINPPKKKSPAANTIYNTGGDIDIFPGKWLLGFDAALMCYGEAVTRMYQLQFGATLADAPDKVNNSLRAPAQILAYANGMGLILLVPTSKQNNIELQHKTKFYLNAFVTQNNTQEVGFEGYVIIFAINSLL